MQRKKLKIKNEEGSYKIVSFDSSVKWKDFISNIQKISDKKVIGISYQDVEKDLIYILDEMDFQGMQDIVDNTKIEFIYDLGVKKSTLEEKEKKETLKEDQKSTKIEFFEKSDQKETKPKIVELKKSMETKKPNYQPKTKQEIVDFKIMLHLTYYFKKIEKTPENIQNLLEKKLINMKISFTEDQITTAMYMNKV